MPTTPLIYSDTGFVLNAESALDRPAGQHLTKVLRLRTGALVRVFNGNGMEYEALITAILGLQVRVVINKQHQLHNESPLNIHLGQVISRGERMDYAIQKAVELGVTSITPLFSKRCSVKLNGERLEKRMEHWRRTIISACEQCGRCQIPKLNLTLKLADWILKSCANKTSFICQPNLTATDWQNLTPVDNTVQLTIGPEGGFDPEELILAKESKLIGMNLGPRILRTETAPVVALSLLQFRWGDFL